SSEGRGGSSMRIGLIALTDFRSFPTGGILTFIRRFVESVSAFDGVTLSLIGWSPRRAAGTRASVRIGDTDLDFHAIGERPFRPLVPDRLQFYADRTRWKRALEATGDVSIYYCHSPEAALRAAKYGCSAPIALHIHGAINSIGRSRFVLGRFRPVAAVYER